MPASMRCVYNCEKEVTGEMNRNKMIKQLQEVALATPDKEEQVKFVPGTIRGKVYVPKSDEDSQNSSKDSDGEGISESRMPEMDYCQEQEYSQVLEEATLDDLIEIADILGVTYQDHCSATELKVFPAEAPNQTNIIDVTKQVCYLV